jgi:hypothetical protein
MARNALLKASPLSALCHVSLQLLKQTKALVKAKFITRLYSSIFKSPKWRNIGGKYKEIRRMAQRNKAKEM